jgi:hypothetical protein
VSISIINQHFSKGDDEMKKMKIWIIVGVVVIGLGVTAIQAELIPASLSLAKELGAEEDLLVAKESEGEGGLPDELPVEVINSGHESVLSVLWCRDEFGRLYSIVESHPSSVVEDPNIEFGMAGYWYRDENGRLYRSAVEVELDQLSGPDVIWYRDEAGRLFKTK